MPEHDLAVPGISTASRREQVRHRSAEDFTSRVPQKPLGDRTPADHRAATVHHQPCHIIRRRFHDFTGGLPPR
ncbi:hypothetical protein ACFQ51_43450 [Streptomyces kaempferi]